MLEKKNLVLIDVRTETKYLQGHIKGARNIPLSVIDSYRGDTTKPVYLICQSGGRSKKARTILSKKGYQAINVNGGMFAWIGKIVGGKK